ncbi:MAG TPA: hypothetical protein VKB43_02465 [Gaiellaceae bacterium]|nr:hypothetical protein [Gaiellaceae bacterium]
MKSVGAAAVLIAVTLATSACGSGHARSATSTTKTDAVTLRTSAGYNSLPWALQIFIHSTIASERTAQMSEIDIYGPGSRAALVKASSGDVVTESPGELSERFYLIVLQGHFVCGECTRPARAKPPHGTIETHVWSRDEGSTDFGLSSSLPAAVSQLHRLATVTLS